MKTMQTVTIAIADADPGRRTKLEQSLRGGEGIKVLTNVMSNGSEASIDRRRKSRTSMAIIEDVVALVARLNPRILFVNLDQSADEDFALLEALRCECPETLVVLLTDKSAADDRIIEALANGARGCLSHESDPFYFSKAAHMVDRGEVWVTRRMLAKIMDKVLH